MRWLILTDDFPPLDGGVATWTATVARGLCAAGDEVTVLARSRPGLGEKDAPYELVGVRGPMFGSLAGVWMSVPAGWRMQFCDRVLATTWTVATHLMGPWASKRPLDLVFHGSDLTRPPLDAQLFDQVCKRAERRFTVSGYLGGVLEKRGFTSAVLPAPVDVSPVRAPSEGPRRWVYVGRATPLKGGDRFVRLVAAAGAEGIVYGGGLDLPLWKRVAAETGARVEFAGKVTREEVRQGLRAADLAFLLPRPYGDGSGAEGFGLTLAEAAAEGCATVGCRTGGVPEAVGAGLVLDRPDDIEGSLAAIKAWWTPDRGPACREWLAGHHGVGRTVEVLRNC